MAPAAAAGGQFEHPAAGHAKKNKRRGPYPIEPMTALYAFAAAALAAALLAPIGDCDETFNYWEPAHYLAHGYGLQTWEYAPAYALRSWLYVAPHALAGAARRLLPRPSKPAEFYAVRCGLGLACALCQTVLWRAVCAALGGRVGLVFLVATVASPGNFQASAAFLPSSFAMGAVMLGAAAFMDWRGGLKTSRAVFCFAAAAVLGWPFAAALCAPFLLEELVLAAFSDKEARIQSALRLGRGVVAGLLLLLFDFLINLFFYKRAVVVTWNIVRYNIFSSTGGPGLYGTEPWHFYFRNLALNFNLWFVLALLALPLFLVQKLSGRGSQPGLPLRTLVFVAPFYMWLAIFTAQPHKEERFMYPVYPFLVLNGSISLHMLLSAIGSSDPNALVARVPARLRLLAVGLVLFLSLDVGLARIYGVYTAYRAPMAIYKPLWGGDEGGGAVGGPEDLVCFGKEWYRFPSSYFLPRDMHAKFVRSEFRGLLPGEFSEARTGFGFWSGTWLPTSGLNDGNREDPGKYVDLRACSLLVDTQYPDRTEPLPPAEPDYVADSETWEVVKCEPFLDAASTHVLARTLWLPDLALVPVRLRRRWGRHCLLKRRTTAN